MLCGGAAALRALVPSARAASGPALGLWAPEAAAPGGTVGWRLAVTNTAALTASGALVALVPAPLEEVAAPGASGLAASPGGTLVTWSIGPLGPGDSLEVAGTARVPGGTATPLTRTLAATATLGAPPVGATAARAIALRRTDLRLELGAEAADVRPTERLTHALALDNLSRAAAEGAVVTLTLDARTTFVADTLAEGGLPWPPEAVSRTVGAGFVRWSLPPLAGPTRVALRVVTRVAPEAPAGASIAHAAVVRAATADASSLDDGVTAAPVPVVVPDLWIRKTGPASADPGEPVDYEIAWGNRGGRARDVVITDTLPPGTSWISSTPSAEVLAGGRVRWLRGTAPDTGEDPLEVVRVRLAVDGASPPGTLLVNRAAIGSSAPDQAPGDDADEAATTVAGDAGPVADLALVAVATGAVAPGGHATMTLAVTNDGPAAAPDAVVSATLPAELVALVASPPGQPGAGGIAWSLGTLGAGERRELVLTATVAADAPVGVIRTLRASARSTAAPGDPSDDAADLPLRLTTTDVRVSLEQAGDAVPGQRVRHAIVLRNDGEAAAEDVVATLRLGPDLAYDADDLDAVPGIGAFERAPLASGVRWTIARLPAGATRSWHVESILDDAAGAGELVTATLSALGATRDDDPAGGAASSSVPALASPVAELAIAAPATMSAGGASAPVTVTLRDAAGQPVPDGTRVRLATTAGSLAEGELRTVRGAASTTLTSAARSGTALLEARAGRVATATVRFLPGPAAALSVGLSAASVPVGEPGTHVLIEANDALGNPVADGTPFAVAADGGQLARQFGSTVGGRAAVAWSSLRAGRDTVTVTVGTLQRSATATWIVGPPVRVALLAEPDEVPAGEGTSRIEATALDAFGNRVPSGLRVAFEASEGSVWPVAADIVDGVASTTWSAPATHGFSTVTATLSRFDAEPLTATTLVRARSADLRLASLLETPRGPVATNQLYPGDEVSYTLRVANEGLIDADGVVLAVELPGEMLLERVVASDDVFQRDPGGAGARSARLRDGLPYAWDLPDLVPGEAVTVTLAGPIARDRPWTGSDSLFYRAEASTTSDAEVEGPLRVSDLVRVVAGDLFIGLRLDESASRVEPGGELVYDVFFGNEQAQTEVIGARITDTLPAWTSLDHWQPAPGVALREVAAPDPDDRELVWAFDAPVPGSGSLRVWLRIADDVPPQTLLVNAVAIGSPIVDVMRGNDDAVDNGAWIPGVDLDADLTGPRALVAGAAGRFEVSVLNAARRDRATGVTAEVVLPPGVAAATIPPEAVVAGGRVSWPVGSLGAGARKRFELELVAPAAATPGQRLSMAASVAGDVPDSAAGNDRAVLEVLIAEPGSTEPAEVRLRAEPGAAGAGSGACPPEPIRLVATVLDGNGLPVSDGTEVRFATTRGTVSAPVTATREGDAVVDLVFPGPGVAEVSASAGRVGDRLDVSGTAGAPYVLSLAASTTAPAVRARVPMTVEARDRCGRVVADGWPIALSAERGRFVGAGAAIEPTTTAGRVTAVLEVGAVPGPLAVVAAHGARSASLVLDVRGAVEPTATPRAGGPAIYLPVVRKRSR